MTGKLTKRVYVGKMAGDATRGPKLVTTTALVIAAILAYYYWTETNISRELFERMQKLQTDMVNANQTIKDQQVATETQKEQLKKLEDDKKMVEAEKAKVEEEKKKLLEEKTKLEEEKKGWDAKNKEAADNALKLATEKVG